MVLSVAVLAALTIACGQGNEGQQVESSGSVSSAATATPSPISDWASALCKTANTGAGTSVLSAWEITASAVQQWGTSSRGPAASSAAAAVTNYAPDRRIAACLLTGHWGRQPGGSPGWTREIALVADSGTPLAMALGGGDTLLPDDGPWPVGVAPPSPTTTPLRPLSAWASALCNAAHSGEGATLLWAWETNSRAVTIWSESSATDASPPDQRIAACLTAGEGLPAANGDRTTRGIVFVDEGGAPIPF